MKTFDEALRSTFCFGAEAENPEVALCIESQKVIMDEGSVSELFHEFIHTAAPIKWQETFDKEGGDPANTLINFAGTMFLLGVRMGIEMEKP